MYSPLKEIREFLLTIMLILIILNASSASGFKSTIFDNRGISRNVDNLTLSYCDNISCHDNHTDLLIRNGETERQISFRNIKEANFVSENGVPYAIIVTIGGETLKGENIRINNDHWYLIGKTDSGNFSLKFSDTIKIIFNGWAAPMNASKYTEEKFLGSSNNSSASLLSPEESQEDLMIEDQIDANGLKGQAIGSGFAESLNETTESFNRSDTSNSA